MGKVGRSGFWTEGQDVLTSAASCGSSDLMSLEWDKLKNIGFSLSHKSSHDLAAVLHVE